MKFTDNIPEINRLSVKELSEKLATKELTSEEVTRGYLQRIKDVNGTLNAYITVTEEEALIQAKKADDMLKSGSTPPLTGIPYAAKDNICTKDVKTTCGSRFLQDFVPPYDAFTAETLKNSNSPLLGKTNMDEFGMGSTTENSFFGATLNPCDTEKVAGGSSGGSAAAVASGCAPFALGSDTGGSVRLPAAFCGVVGLKPTYGRLSRNGLVAFASSMDCISILAKTVTDSAIILSEMTKWDKNDGTNVNIPYENLLPPEENGVKGIKIAIPKELFAEETDHETEKNLINAIEVLRNAGAEINYLSVPSLKFALPAYYIISSAEASSNLARFDGVRYGRRGEGYSDMTELYKISRSRGFGAEVKRRIMMGTYVLSEGFRDEFYEKATAIRKQIRAELEEVYKNHNVILSPVAPSAAYESGSTPNPVSRYKGDVFTVTANLAGVPAIAVPFGKTKTGLPLSVQLMGGKFEEKTLIRTAKVLERGADL